MTAWATVDSCPVEPVVALSPWFGGSGSLWLWLWAAWLRETRAGGARCRWFRVSLARWEEVTTHSTAACGSPSPSASQTAVWESLVAWWINDFMSITDVVCVRYVDYGRLAHSL